MTPKIVLLNGSPRCGKDTLADGLCERLWYDYAVTNMKMAQPLHDYWEPIWGGIPADKNAVDPRFGMSYRQACITLSEEYMKPNFGQDIFGKILVGRMQSYLSSLNETPCVIVSDSGFLPETIPIIEAFGAENILHIKIVRDGCDFSQDSRGYLNLDDFGVKSELIRNTSLDSYLQNGVNIVTEFMNS